MPVDIIERFREIVADAPGPLTLIELGAHNGYHTRLMAETVHASGKPFRFYAFEPDQRQHPYLIENTAPYGVEIIPAAIGAVDSDGVVFYISDGIQQREGEGHLQRFDGSSSIRQPTEHNAAAFPDMTFRTAKVRTIKLDTFCKAHGIDHIDFIWADIQGAEVDLITGGRESLAKTGHLYTEYCDGELYEGEIGLEQIKKLLPAFEVVQDYGGDVLLRNLNRPLLSILICSLGSRHDLLQRLLAGLQPQLDAAGNKVELIVDIDDGAVSIGAKRQRMLERATGRYVCFIDDDDLVSDQYIVKILAAVAAVPDADCVGFKVACYTDEKLMGIATHSMRYVKWADIRDGAQRFYERCPNHLSPVRAELARRVGFQPINWAEDKDYSHRLRPLLKSEAFIDEVLYTYLHRRKASRKGELVHAG